MRKWGKQGKIADLDELQSLFPLSPETGKMGVPFWLRFVPPCPQSLFLDVTGSNWSPNTERNFKSFSLKSGRALLVEPLIPMGVAPANHRRPQVLVCLPPYKHPHMLQRHSRVSFIPEKLCVGTPDGVVERLDCLRRNELASPLNDAQHGSTHELRCRPLSPHPQGSFHEAVFAIQQLNDLFKQALCHRHLFKGPALDAQVGRPGVSIWQALYPIQPPGPAEGDRGSHQGSSAQKWAGYISQSGSQGRSPGGRRYQGAKNPRLGAKMEGSSQSNQPLHPPRMECAEEGGKGPSQGMPSQDKLIRS